MTNEWPQPKRTDEDAWKIMKDHEASRQTRHNRWKWQNRIIVGTGLLSSLVLGAFVGQRFLPRDLTQGQVDKTISVYNNCNLHLSDYPQGTIVGVNINRGTYTCLFLTATPGVNVQPIETAAVPPGLPNTGAGAASSPTYQPPQMGVLEGMYGTPPPPTNP